MRPLMEMTLTDSIIPDGFLRFSDAISRLAVGRGGPAPMQLSSEPKKIEKKRRLDRVDLSY